MDHPIVTRADSLAPRLELLAREKAFTRARDDLARARRALPWVRVDKQYEFETLSGRKNLADLFAGRSQLIVQHFMFSPDWDEGCVGCSFSADHVDGALPHIQARDASFVAVSRAPLSKIEPFKRRMGWRFDWVSSFGSDFNYDFNVSFRREDIAEGRAEYNYRPLDFEIGDLSGVSTFIKQGEAVFHTYSTFARGDEMLMTAYMFIDLLPKGRDEANLKSPSSWWRHHDRYDADERHSCCQAMDGDPGPA
ncbi:MAG: DUF899 domain-containing protein [Rhizobiales bacterium]|nr:DUF899 domain-containing protein [Hyphomicrobiales bacterium]